MDQMTHMTKYNEIVNEKLPDSDDDDDLQLQQMALEIMQDPTYSNSDLTPPSSTSTMTAQLWTII